MSVKPVPKSPLEEESQRNAVHAKSRMGRNDAEHIPSTRQSIQGIQKAAQEVLQPETVYRWGDVKATRNCLLEKVRSGPIVSGMDPVQAMQFDCLYTGQKLIKHVPKKIANHSMTGPELERAVRDIAGKNIFEVDLFIDAAKECGQK